MRFHLLAAVLLASIALPAAAQNTNGRLDRRVEKLEDEMRAVQRKVFPGGNVQPEITPEVVAPALGGVPASTPLADLTARVDSLERQLANLTGQVEEGANRLRQLEESMSRFRTEAQGRLDAMERSNAAAAAALAPASLPEVSDAAPAAATATPASSRDPAEDAYNAGFRLWEGGKFTEAQKALEAVAKQYPKHKRASWALNLAGRAYLDGGKPATAAKVLLSNYQANPKGERAADSLYFLGQALVQLKKPVEACQVYAELQDVYGTSMRDWLKQRLPKARADAKCGA